MRRPAALAAAVAATVICAAASGCSSSPHRAAPAAPTTSSTVTATAPLPAPPAGLLPCAATATCSGEQVLAAALTTVFGYHPADPDPAQAAADRAGDWVSPLYRQQMGATWSMLLPITGATWAHWATDHAAITPQLVFTGDEHPADTATKVWRTVHLRLQTTPPTAPPVEAVLWVMATAGGPAGWQLASIATQS